MPLSRPPSASPEFPERPFRVEYDRFVDPAKVIGDSGGARRSGLPGAVPHCDTSGWGRGETIGAVAAVALAFAVRAVSLASTDGVPLLRHLIGDAAGYLEWARRIAGGDWIGSEAFYQAPLYPYVLALLFKVAGPSLAAVRWVQAAWGAAAVGCLYYGTRRLMGRRAALLAAAMLALYAPAAFFDGIVQKASLDGLLVYALLAVVARASARPSRASWAAVGVLLGSLILTRENAVVWIPVVAAWAFTVRRRAKACEAGAQTVERSRSLSAKYMTLFVVGLAAVLGPVALRNAVVGGEWSISTFQAGPNFYIGNGTGATGRYVPLVRGHETPAFERSDATLLAQQEFGRPLSAREVSRYWTVRALREIRQDPVRWLKLMAHKTDLVGNRYEVSDAESLYVYEAFSPVLRALGRVWHFGVLCPLAAAGLVLTRGRWRELWLLYALIAAMAFSVVLFYVMARYRFPLVPLLIPFAAAGCVGLWDRFRAGELRAVGMPLLVAVVVALVVNRRIVPEERLDALAWMNVGVSCAQAGEIEEAVAYFRKAVAGHPQSAEANNNLAQALAVLGRYAESIPFYRAAVASAPNLPGVDYNLGVAFEHVGRIREALDQYRRAVAVDPNDTEAAAAVRRLTNDHP